MSNPEIVVSQAGPQDFDDVYALFEKLDVFEATIHPSVQESDGPVVSEAERDADHRKRINEYLSPERSDRVGFIARHIGSDAVVGYALASVTGFALTADNAGPHYKVAMLGQLYVEGAHRRHGVGGILESTVCGWAASQGAVRIALLALEQNDIARAFYRAKGYDEVPPDAKWNDVMFEKGLGQFPPRPRQASN